MTDTEDRILTVAVEMLGADPDAGMGEVALAAGVVRRTVYGYFPNRAALVRAITTRAVTEILEVLRDADRPDRSADAAWVACIARVWPLAHRYRVLVVLRRGEFGADIHALLAPVDRALADLVARGQADGSLGRHLPADVLGQLAWSAVFAIADHDLARDDVDLPAAVTTSLLLLGVPADRAAALLREAGPDVTERRAS